MLGLIVLTYSPSWKELNSGCGSRSLRLLSPISGPVGREVETELEVGLSYFLLVITYPAPGSPALKGSTTLRTELPSGNYTFKSTTVTFGSENTYSN